jgi:hypothetical protein
MHKSAMPVAIYARWAVLSQPIRGMMRADDPAGRRFSIIDGELTCRVCVRL